MLATIAQQILHSMFVTPHRVKVSRAKYVRVCNGVTNAALSMIKRQPAERLILSAKWRDYGNNPKSMLAIKAKLQAFSNHTAAVSVFGVVPQPRNPVNPLMCLWGNVNEGNAHLMKGTNLKCPREFEIDPEDMRLEASLKKWLNNEFPRAQYISPITSRLCRKFKNSYKCKTWSPDTGAYYHDSMGHMTLLGALEATSVLTF